jgi:hypothetical protein
VTTSFAARRQSVSTDQTVFGGAAMSMAAWISPAPSVSGSTSAQALPCASVRSTPGSGAQANAGEVAATIAPIRMT